MLTVSELGKNAKIASRSLIPLSDKIDKALLTIANDLRKHKDDIINANKLDLENGEKNGMSKSMLDRLMLDESRIESIAKGIEKIISMESPIGKVLWENEIENGLKIQKISVPLGVIGIIYEARPNVTADAAALCLKAQNAVILRGGKEAINSNKAIAEIMRNAVFTAGLPKDCICLVEDTSRESANELMRMREYLDVLIPRGGKGLISSVVENAKVPVIETGVGNCHAFVDESADIDMAAKIVFNAKTSRVSVCNALETLLVHKNIAEKALPKICAKLKEKNVEIRGCEKTLSILSGEDNVVPATEDDFKTEFLDYIISVKVVDSFDEAIDHITKYSSGHSETIITQDKENAEKFLSLIDSAAVYVNASTRFTDGGEFGLGAEIGISTQKLHARGPMGTSSLTSSKFIIHGDGQIR